MIQLYKMALRDLGRNRRRSFFSALALAIGLALLLLMASVIQGEYRGSIDTSIRLQSGHLQVRAKTYNEDKTSLKWEDLVAAPSQVAAQIATLPPVAVATPRLFANGIVASGNDSTGVRIIGMDPASAANAPYRDGLIRGAYLTADDREGILIGQPLSEKLLVKTGDQVNLLVNTSNGDTAQQTFIVRGVYSTRTPAFDQSTIFMPLAKAQGLAQAGDHASTIFVLLKDQDQTAAVAAALQSTNYQVTTWQDANQVLLQTEALSNAYISMLYLIVLGITATVIVNTLIMSVFERTREIGILAAIGMKGRRIMAMFLAESSLLAVGGIVLGLVVGGLLVLYATQVGFYVGSIANSVSGMLLGERIYGYATLNDTVTLTIIAFVVTLLAALYPAMLASRMEPVDALRGGK